MKITKLTIDDVEIITPFFVDTFNGPPWNDGWTIERASSRIKEIISTPGYVGYMAYSDDEILGAVMGNISTGPKRLAYYMYEFFTTTNCRRKGVGQKIYDKLLEDLKTKNCESIFLTTIQNSAAYNFYRKNKIFELKDSAVMFGLI